MENGFCDKILGNTLRNEAFVMDVTGADGNMVCFGLAACIRSALRIVAFGYNVPRGST